VRELVRDEFAHQPPRQPAALEVRVGADAADLAVAVETEPLSGHGDQTALAPHAAPAA